MAKNMYMGQRVLGTTYIPSGNWAKGREYFWMQDIEGTIYLVKMGEDGNPDFS